ncbi:MAG: hypothetical protein M0011_10495, partial [Elusimicrobia bacterium]|nr:hypothetical protein [Elusimicrobiota bacterium]
MRITAALLLLLFSSARAFAAAYGAGYYDTSEFMMGKVAVAVVFPQSNGALQTKTEGTWSAARKNDVLSRIQEGMAWWTARKPGANLSFVYVTTTVATGYEPINCNANASSTPATPPCNNGEQDWINDVMGRMGYNDADYFERVYHYDNDVRTANHTDWAFTIFVVDSLNSSTGEFPDNYFAYAYLGGPFVMTTYDNDSYGIGYYAPVVTHETGHIFYAQDEYAASACTPTTYTGYLNIPNSNCENGGSSNTSCIMRGDIYPYYPSSGSCPTCNGPVVCSYTQNMIGWRDTNSNGIPDIADLPPTTALAAFAPDPTTNTDPVYYGMAHSTGVYTNSNPYTSDTNHYWYTSSRNNIGVNRIASVEYQVDGGGWLAATARDGAFDQNIDSFTFTASTLAEGAHTIQARAKDNFGAYDATPAADSLTVNTGQATDIPYVYDGTGADAEYTRSKSSLSANWGASSHSSGISHYNYAIGTTAGASNTVGWTSVGTALSVTKTGLTLAEAGVYYFSVQAFPNVGTPSGVTSSNGIRVDTSSPTAKVLVTSPQPAKNGAFTAKLIVNELNALSGQPRLGFTASNGLYVPLSLTYLAASTWTASGYIESYYSTGTANFNFSASDLAGNSGALITAGGSFGINTSFPGGTGATIANSDGNSVALPPGAYSGTLFVSISTVAPSVTAAADAASPESVKVFATDLVRQFTARDTPGAPVTAFSSPLTITMPYPDADNDGRIDGDLLKASMAWIYYMDPSAGRWTPLPGVTRDAAAKTLSAQVSHFSVYSIRAAGSSQADIGSLKAYPNPCDFRLAPSLLTIQGVPADAVNTCVYIYNEAGELVRSLAPGDGIDGLNIASWDGRTSGGG